MKQNIDLVLTSLSKDHVFLFLRLISSTVKACDEPSQFSATTNCDWITLLNNWQLVKLTQQIIPVRENFAVDHEISRAYLHLRNDSERTSSSCSVSRFG